MSQPQIKAELPLDTPDIYEDVAAVIQQMGERFTRLDGPQPHTLFDPDEPSPQYLGEELDDWMIGWDALKWYFETPERFAMIEAMDYHPSNIQRAFINVPISRWPPGTCMRK